MIKVKNFAAFDFRRFAGLDSQSPRNIVEANFAPVAEPPMTHRVEDSANVVLREIYKRASGNTVHQTALENKRQIETDYVMSDKLV
jgi:hypothetical protein